MKRMVKLVGVATLVAFLAVALAGAVVLAQEPEDEAGTTFNLRERLHQAVANVLGVDVEEYDAAVETAGQQVLDEAVTEGWLTAEQAERMQDRWAQGGGMMGGRGGMMGGRGGMMGGRGGMMGGRGGMMGGPQSSLLTVAAEELGMTVDELVAELEAGQTIADVAAARGVEPQAIVDAFIATRAEWMAQAVAAGRMTQEQVDAMLAQMSEAVLEHLSQPYDAGIGGPGGCPGMGPGGYQNYPGTDES